MYVLIPHLNPLNETVQMRVHNIIMVSMRNKKNYLSIIIKYSLLFREREREREGVEMAEKEFCSFVFFTKNF